MTERDLVGIFRTVQEEFGRRVHHVSPDQWHDRTPNSAWDVGQLVAHLITEQRWVEPLVRGLDIDAAAAEVDALPPFLGVDDDGTRYVQAWDEAAARAAAAFSAPGALERPVQLSRGETLVNGYIREMIFDLTVHSWDLGRAIGYPGELPTPIVQAVWEESHHFGDLSASGMFDSPVDVPADAPVIDRLIALTGRDPR